MKLHASHRIFASCTLLFLAAVPRQVLAQSAALPKQLESARALLDKYNDVVVAVYDGFYSTIGCIEYPKGASEGSMKYAPGGMGVHLLNMGNVGPTLDPLWSSTAIQPIAGSETTNVLLWIGYFYGPGALILYLSGLAHGLLARPARPEPVVVAEPIEEPEQEQRTVVVG